ncbi:EamA family transporter [Pontibacillus litoralis]|uniref:Transporter n=1 Tax=Pontibacillus litoralis JSM 072002 TaxID=1385512 RepID=A0A0A5G1U5_9BACI|nr:EamA family transporter [Pontibacillus litoralis]KGX85113.1 transporter [Pontibacillus litoralis JSM 072002]
MVKQNRKIGLILVIAGALFWGIGGTVAQKLFQISNISVEWLVTVRLLLSGIILLFIHFITKGYKQIITIWTRKDNVMRLLIFTIFGMLAVQYTYLAAIDAGNAAVATLLQYLAPVFIIIYLVLRKQSVLTQSDIVTVLLALIGCFFLLTNGSLSELSVPIPAIIWGILAGISLAFYTLYAVPLLKQFNTLVVVGWAMLIGGLLFSFVSPPWQVDLSSFTLESFYYLIFAIVFGSLLAYWFYIESLQYLDPKEASLLSSLEPLAAVFTTVIWLKEPFGIYQWVGTACIIIMILLITVGKKSR